MKTISEHPQLVSFIDYCASFYWGPNAIYPIEGLSLEMLEACCHAISLKSSFEADSLDRELVRDLCVQLYDLKFN